MQLINYEEAKRALSEAVQVDEVKDTRDKSIAVAAYARQAGDKDLEINARELRLRAERRLGQLIDMMPKAKGAKGNKSNQYEKEVRGNENPAPLTFDDIGVDKNLAKAARVAARVADDEFEDILEDCRSRGEVVTLAKLKHKTHVSHNSNCNEWYTPPRYIEAARQAMGSIDLDPCSSEVAQANVRATEYFTIEDDGLDYEWSGNVWMNPPYGKDLIGMFCDELVAAFDSGNVTQACVLVNNATETAWFQSLLECASATCLPSGRIKFLDVTGEPAKTPLQGQAVIYFGENIGEFCDAFEAIGRCLVRRTL